MIDSLLTLLPALHARDADAVLGWRDGQPVPVGRFLARVASWQALLAGNNHRNCALYLEDSLDFAAALLACWQAGKTVWLSADTLASSCDALAAKVDCFVGEFPARYLPVNLDAESPLGPLSLELAALPEPLRSGVPGGAISRGENEVAKLSADNLALVVHTSGTTGSAQAIPKRLAQLAAEVATLESVFGNRLGARMQNAAIVATVSHQHIYGLLFKVLWPLCAGRAIHARSESYPEPLAQLLAQQPCVLITSPAHLKRLPAHLAWPKAQLRAVFSSGGPLPADVAQSAGQLLGQVAIEVYGSSETGGVAWRQRTLGASFAASVDTPWQALPGVEWRLEADNQQLAVRSPHLPDEEWLTLADRAKAADSGHFLLLGRLDRIIKIEEKRVSLDAIEALLCTSPLVAQARIVLCDAPAAATGQAPATSQRQQLAAFVVPSDAGQQQLERDGKPAFNQCLRRLLQDQVEAVAVPRRWRYLHQLPLNAQGKTTHALLLALLDELPAEPRPRLPHLRELARSEAHVTLEITVPASLLYFDGHFPQVPILPGVVQVDWALHYGRQYFGLPPDFCGMHALKFQYVIQANCPVTLELQHDALKGSLNFRYFSPAGQHASGRLLFSRTT